MLAAQVHIGTRNSDSQMQDYIWRRRQVCMHAMSGGARGLVWLVWYGLGGETQEQRNTRRVKYVHCADPRAFALSNIGLWSRGAHRGCVMPT